MVFITAPNESTGSSPVTSFEKAGEEFVDFCKAKGVTVCRIASVFDERKGYKATEGTEPRAHKLRDNAINAEKEEKKKEKEMAEMQLMLSKTPKMKNNSGASESKNAKSADDDISKSSVESVNL